MKLCAKENISESLAIGVLALLAIAAYVLHLGLNDIWTPNEGFYADAAREMLASKNFLDIYYNYVPRYNKPPLQYWLIALTGKITGLNEIAVRLPSALAGLGSVFLVYRIGNLLESRTLGIWAAIVLTFSFQFAINARYGTPELVLTFFFTLSIYWLLIAFHQNRVWWLLGAYIALGLAILTKGYPYLIVIGTIMLVYLIADGQAGDKNWLRRLRFLRLYWGLPLALAIGLSWVGYMYWHHGSEFGEVFLRETYHRAFTRKGAFRPFFYLEACTWGFLPYSPIFFGALIWLAGGRFRDFGTSKVVRLGLIWFGSMLVIFTLARGKIPTYFIQAHPGMSLLAAYFIVHFRPAPGSWRNYLFKACYLIPGILFLVGGFAMVWRFGSSPGLYFLSLFPLVLLWLGLQFRMRRLALPVFPFTTFACSYLIFSLSVMPYMEQFRPHRELGKIISERGVNPTVPLMVENFHLHSLPFYAKRKMWEYSTDSSIREQQAKGPVLLLVREERAKEFGPGQVLWKGLLYGQSESRTLEFLLDCMALEKGERGHFIPFILIYQP